MTTPERLPLTAGPLAAAPLWAGRTVALLGIVLAALNMRTAVGAISPIVPEISPDIPLDNVVLGLLGSIPPFAFAIAGAFGALGVKRLGLERFMAAALVVAIVGHALRAVAPNVATLVVGTLLVLLSAGIANVLFPPLIKRYFPDRIGVLTAAYLSAMSIGGAAAALLAALVATTAGWRVSLAVWGGLVIVGLVPWLAMLAQHRRERAALAGTAAPEVEQPSAVILESMWRSRTAWALVVLLAASAIHIFSVFAWLPAMAFDLAHESPAGAGALVALFTAVSLPFNLLIPVIIARYGRVRLILFLALGLGIAGYAGMYLFPAPLTWLWVLCLGGGAVVFPACLVLINVRTRTHEGSVALSAFVQGAGYAIGAAGPLVIGVLHDLSAGWLLPLSVMAVIGALAALMVNQAGRRVFVEDQLGVRS